MKAVQKSIWFGTLTLSVIVVVIGERAFIDRSQSAAAEPTARASRRPAPLMPVDPDLSLPLDPASVRAGEELFRHEWAPHDPQTPDGDGIGPVYNATSCVACHGQGGPGGSGTLAQNVTTFTYAPGQLYGYRRDVQQGVIHAHSTHGRDETLHDIHRDLPPVPHASLVFHAGRADTAAIASTDGAKIALPAGFHLSQRNPGALFGARLIDAVSEAEILANEDRQQRERARTGNAESPAGRAVKVAGSKVGRFGWKAQSASLADFVRLACANEMGLGNPGHEQSIPLYCPTLRPCSTDLTNEQCNQLAIFVASLPRPEERMPAEAHAANEAAAGKKLFHTVGCAACHLPDIGSASGLYSDLLVHDLGEALSGDGSYFASHNRPSPREWRTAPLWGVADSAPYLHDGRAPTLQEAILLHGGEASGSAARFKALGGSEQRQVVAFLQTLRAPVSR
jgi:CxxC motif-containing protein (DUF1111 family)